MLFSVVTHTMRNLASASKYVWNRLEQYGIRRAEAELRLRGYK